MPIESGTFRLVHEFTEIAFGERFRYGHSDPAIPRLAIVTAVQPALAFLSRPAAVG